MMIWAVKYHDVPFKSFLMVTLMLAKNSKYCQLLWQSLVNGMHLNLNFHLYFHEFYSIFYGFNLKILFLIFCYIFMIFINIFFGVFLSMMSFKSLKVNPI